MFPSWVVRRSFVFHQRANQALAVLLLLAAPGAIAAPVLASDNVAEPGREATTTNEVTTTKTSVAPKLKLGIRWVNPTCSERLTKQMKDVLSLAACLGDFDCRLSSECLSRAWPKPLVLDGPFEDSLLNIPVKGDAHVEGMMKLIPVADTQRAVLDVIVEGTAHMQGSGSSHRVKIDSDAAVRYQATKRLFLDQNGLTCLPATCTADSTLVIKGITSRSPRLLGKFTERVAQQLVTDSQEEAEAECSAHVSEAVCAAVDREFARMAEAINIALTEHLQSSTPDYQARWQTVRFSTETGGLSITRDTEGAAFPSFVIDDRRTPPIVLRLPRTAPDVQRLLAGGMLLLPSRASARVTSDAPSTAPLRSSVTWQEETLTVSLDYRSPTRLAQEPVVGAAQ